MVKMEFSYPEEVNRIKENCLPVFLPVGTMEYHSHHCPFGTDTMVALGVSEKIAEQVDGLVLPPIWYGVASYAVGGPDKNTINVDVDTLEDYVTCILDSLFKSGFKKNIFIMIAHQTEDYMPMTLACMKAAKKLIMAELEQKGGYGWWGKRENADFYENLSGSDSPWNKVRFVLIPETPSFKGDSDHAGVVECSMVEYLYSGSIKLDRHNATDDWFAESAVNTSIELGEKLVNCCVNDVIKMIKGE